MIVCVLVDKAFDPTASRLFLKVFIVSLMTRYCFHAAAYLQLLLSGDSSRYCNMFYFFSGSLV